MTTHSSNEPILTWLSAVRSKASDLPHSARSVALAILTHVHPETGMTPPLSYAALQQEAGCSRGTLVAALRRLDDAGMIRRFGAHQQLNVYSLAVDNSLASAVEPGTEFAPTPVQPLTAADHVGSDSAPTRSKFCTTRKSFSLPLLLLSPRLTPMPWGPLPRSRCRGTGHRIPSI
ncbi:hypothetical protein GS432_04985 [Rhodococcus hoagii]|nr:hypothetical protein [Prescottella equi]